MYTITANSYKHSALYIAQIHMHGISTGEDLNFRIGKFAELSQIKRTKNHCHFLAMIEIVGNSRDVLHDPRKSPMI